MATDALFKYIEEQQAERPWDRVLDAGTGEHSLRWVQSLDTTGWTAVTVDATRTQEMLPKWEPLMRSSDQIVLGSWTDPDFLKGEQFDVVLVDYLIGAIDAFAPYFQNQIFARLRPHVKDTLYMIGLEPFPDRPTEPAHQLIVDLSKTINACRLLAGMRAYREFPASWAEYQLQQSGYVVEKTRHFGTIFRTKYLNSQVQGCFRTIDRLKEPDVARAMRSRVERIRDQLVPFANARQGIRLGSDYVITAHLAPGVDAQPDTTP